MNTTTEILRHKLTQDLSPEYLEVINESHRHNVPPSSETHFKLIIVSSLFDNMSLIKRHQKIYALVQSEMTAGIHALSLHTFTPQEWATKNHSVTESPNCRGGLAKAL